MRKKYGKFYADWRDEHGHRRMKALSSKKAAISYQTKMRRAVRAKKAQASARLRTSARPGQKRVGASAQTQP